MLAVRAWRVWHDKAAAADEGQIVGDHLQALTQLGPGLQLRYDVGEPGGVGPRDGAVTPTDAPQPLTDAGLVAQLVHGVHRYHSVRVVPHERNDGVVGLPECPAARSVA